MSMASPSSRNQTSSPRSYSSAFASTSTSTSSTSFSPVRVQEHRPLPSKSERNKDAVSSSSEKRTCMCSPTNHPGSFRCAYHKQLAEKQKQQTTSLSCRRLNLLRSAMKNSVVRIGGVEGDQIVRRALTTTLIRPSSHHLRRRETFQPRPTRLSLMSKAQDH
ncbi:hypothetical protein AAZX31_15G005400 [Glycine max]|uniref:Serine-rich protein n=1 Tax=Glycine max TaxID=3847 RepID=I1MCD3_SOYBN|nr:hypothetical protein JHK85_041684 [Glycine max]KAG5104044.1 hypothetical protein JHK82_041014 [Glycine max]KAH1144839.1 hypothetical protein GYH30_040929 [Glycine max]KAH1207316.1 hypothetical protein GmHk_15G042455 [Glycine max]KRH09694.1 hypothetical protein GLYMA_15G005600v4 [Glycine max]|eukprot:XP_025981480.1 uncharacterized protein LOC112999538 [Glycine max]